MNSKEGATRPAEHVKSLVGSFYDPVTGKQGQQGIIKTHKNE